jgi:hypothetical protein
VNARRQRVGFLFDVRRRLVGKISLESLQNLRFFNAIVSLEVVSTRDPLNELHQVVALRIEVRLRFVRGGIRHSNQLQIEQLRYPLHGCAPLRIVAPVDRRKEIVIEIEDALARLNAEHLVRYTHRSRPGSRKWGHCHVL